jgi:hypothetical protein
MAHRTALALLFASACAMDGGCLGIATSSSRSRVRAAPPVNCGGTSRQLCFLACGVCTTPELALSLDDDFFNAYCTAPVQPLPASAVTLSALANALVNASEVQGIEWIEANVTQAYSALLSGMPLRDQLVLFKEPFTTLDFLAENVRYTLNTWPFAASLGVPWDIFLTNVLPYSFLDEKVDWAWRWRPRFSQLFTPLLNATLSTTTAVMHVLSDAIPAAQTLGLLGFTTTGAVPGNPITWMSETSPGYLSPQQVASRGASCTGTAIVLGAVARAVGIPARVAGCSESVARGDDHHWVEFFDGTSPGPFGDGWHTKEGVSKGNEGGPWDSPSGPMLGCAQGVVPQSAMDTLWAASWGSATYLPTLWSNDAWDQTWSFVGGENRCGTYCQAWGCGANNSVHYTQAQCGPQ